MQERSSFVATQLEEMKKIQQRLDWEKFSLQESIREQSEKVVRDTQLAEMRHLKYKLKKDSDAIQDAKAHLEERKLLLDRQQRDIEDSLLILSASLPLQFKQQSQQHSSLMETSPPRSIGQVRALAQSLVNSYQQWTSSLTDISTNNANKNINNIINNNKRRDLHDDNTVGNNTQRKQQKQQQQLLHNLIDNITTTMMDPSTTGHGTLDPNSDLNTFPISFSPPTPTTTPTITTTTSLSDSTTKSDSAKSDRDLSGDGGQLAKTTLPPSLRGPRRSNNNYQGYDDQGDLIPGLLKSDDETDPGHDLNNAPESSTLINTDQSKPHLIIKPTRKPITVRKLTPKHLTPLFAPVPILKSPLNAPPVPAFNNLEVPPHSTESIYKPSAGKAPITRLRESSSPIRVALLFQQLGGDAGKTFCLTIPRTSKYSILDYLFGTAYNVNPQSSHGMVFNADFRHFVPVYNLMPGLPFMSRGRVWFFRTSGFNDGKSVTILGSSASGRDHRVLPLRTTFANIFNSPPEQRILSKSDHQRYDEDDPFVLARSSEIRTFLTTSADQLFEVDYHASIFWTEPLVR